MTDYAKDSIEETTIYIIKPHWIKLTSRGMIALFLAVGSAVTDFMLFIFYAAVAIIIFLPALIPFLTNKLTITNKRVIGKIGLINTKELDSPLNRVNDVSVSSGLLGENIKLWKYSYYHIIGYILF